MNETLNNQTANNQQQIPAFGGTQQMAIGQPPMMNGQGFMQAPPDMNMWGNSELTGEQVLNGDNFTAPADLGEITDTSGANIDVNSFGDRNGFGFPPAGMLPPPMMGNGGQFAQSEQAASTEQETK